jgi:hypothetical protein
MKISSTKYQQNEFSSTLKGSCTISKWYLFLEYKDTSIYEV